MQKIREKVDPERVTERLEGKIPAKVGLAFILGVLGLLLLMIWLIV